jgi:diguanylate cyclase (GGDEF)-like protein
MTETVSAAGWMLCIASDITELRTAERSLRQDRDSARKASQTDELSGISNRRHCMSVLQGTIAKANAGEVGETCVALLDIDRFKQINDRFGHQFGDAVLIDFGKSVQRNLRPADSFGRVGGEEFLLILPQLGPAAAELLIERLFKRIGRPGCLPSEPNFHYSFSAGLTQIRSGDTLAEVYHRADAALYEAKIGGRGRQMSRLSDWRANRNRLWTTPDS